MNRILPLLFLLLAVSPTRAHDHVEVGEDPTDSARLGFDGPTFQLALYVPPGEPFSGYVPNFPGNRFANELTFTTDVNALNPAAGADPRIELVSVSGPAGGSFAFCNHPPAGFTSSGSSAKVCVFVHSVPVVSPRTIPCQNSQPPRGRTGVSPPKRCRISP